MKHSYMAMKIGNSTFDYLQMEVKCTKTIHECLITEKKEYMSIPWTAFPTNMKRVF